MSNVILKSILAVFFLCVGGMILLSEQNGRPIAFKTVLGINPGWLAVIFGVINLLRAWLAWSNSKSKREKYDALQQQWARHRHRPHARATEPPDPNFQFTDQPPAIAGTQGTALPTLDTDEAPAPRPAVRKHWERQGGAVGFLLGGVVGLLQEWGPLFNGDEMAALADITFFCFGGAILGALLGSFLGIFIAQSRPQDSA